MVFDCAFENVKPEFPPVAPFIAGAENQLHDLHRSLAGLQRKCARSKLCNLMSNFPLLPMQTIMFREDFHRGLPAVRSRRPDILCQGHHGIRRQLVDLDLESTQDLRHESMRRQTKASGEKGLEDDQLAFRLRDLLRPRDTRHSAAKISKLLHVLHADRGHPRRDELHCVTRMQLLRRHIAQRILGRCASRRCIGSRRGRGRHGYIPSAVAAVCFTRARSPTSRSKEGRRAIKRFQKEARVLRQPAVYRQFPPFVQHAARRRPTTRSLRLAASSNTKAHVEFGPL
jgi:hypothetical protein